MISMGVGNNHWPKNISEDAMRLAMADTGWATKPIQTQTDLGIGMKMACPCGCHSVGVYNLVDQECVEIDGVQLSAIHFQDAKSMPELMPFKHTMRRTWLLVHIQSAYGPKGKTHRELASKMADMIPGIRDRVPSPCNCKTFTRPIWEMIQHLNDAHHPDWAEMRGKDPWTREQIADWLEALDADLVLDPDHKAPPPTGPSYDQQVAMIEKFNIEMAVSMTSIKTILNEVSESISKLAETMVGHKPYLKVKDVHALSSAFLAGGEVGMIKVMAEKGITPMQVEEAFMQPHSVEKHEPCLCLICKIQKKKTNQEES